MQEYQSRWTDLAVKLENEKFLLINEALWENSFVERPVEIASALRKTRFPSNHGLFVYSVSKSIGDDEKVAVYSGLSADFLGDMIRTYDRIVETRENESRSQHFKPKLSSYELVCMYTSLMFLENRTLFEISKSVSRENFFGLLGVLSNFPYISISDRTRETTVEFYQKEIADKIIDGISDYGRILGMVAAIPVAKSSFDINQSANSGKNFCAGMHIADDIYDFLSGKDITGKKFGNHVFSRLADFAKPDDKLFLHKYARTAPTKDDVEKIIELSVTNGTIDSVANEIRKFMSLSKKEFLQIPTIKNPTSQEFVVDTFDYVDNAIDYAIRRIHSDPDYVSRIKHLPRENVVQSRMPCSYFLE